MSLQFTVDADGNSFRIVADKDEIVLFEPGFSGNGLGVLKNPGIQYLAVYFEMKIKLTSQAAEF